MNKTLLPYSYIQKALLKCCLLLFFIGAVLNQNFSQPICAGDMIPNTTTAIAIDANIEPIWNLAPAHQITNTVIGALPAGFVGTQWRALYDAANLYVLVEVNDNVVMNANHGNWWDDDAVELYIDGDNVRGTNYDNNTFQYGFRVTTLFNADPVVHIGGNSVNNNTGIVFKMIEVGGGYIVEIKVPWSTININGTAGTPFDGKRIGIDVAVDENDIAGGNRQGQIATYSQTDQTFVNPQNFGVNTMTVCIAAPLSLLQTSTNTSCNGNADGTIRLNAEGGTAPYTYSIDGGVSFPSATGYFTALAPNTYSVSVKDAAGTVVNGTTITIADPVNLLAVRSDTTICAGTAVPLNASGSANNTYAWTFSPNNAGTAGLSSVTIANPTATPTATTTYTVTGQSSANLIANPDFEAGNVGFYSNYTYYNTQTTARKVYAVTNSPLNLDQYFTSCGDHTNGAGKMMVIDGSAFATDTLWYQSVHVLPNTNYIFSYWIQNVSSPGTPSVARVQTKINGIALGVNNAPTVFACGNWIQVSIPWFSAANSTAAIALYDINVTGIGNDFALDDFYFNSSCPVTKSVTITVDPAPAAPVYTVTQPTCAAPSGTIAITNTSAGYTYSFNNGVSFGTSATQNNLTPGNYQVIIKNATGCNSPASALITINAAPSAPVLLAANITSTQPTCTIATGSIMVNSPSSGVEYSFDNGLTFQPGAVKNNLPADSIYKLVVRAIPGNCISAMVAVKINARPETPIAAFTASVATACAGTGINFTDQSTPAGTIAIWNWNFGDGSPVDHQQHPSHIYTLAGTYRITLSVSTAGGCSSTAAATKDIIIDPLPTAGFTAAVDCVNKAVAFANASNGNGGTITAWTWNYDDGSGVHVVTNGNAFTWPYPSGGSHNVTLTVKTSAGCSNAVPFAKTIAFGASPVAAFTAADLCQFNSTATFNNTSSISDGTLMTYTWDFGDASVPVQVVPAAPPAAITHSFPSGGNYIVSLTATSAGGCVGNISKQVSIVNIPEAHDSIVDRSNRCSSVPVKIVNLSAINGAGVITKVEVFWDYPDAGNKTTDNQPATGNIYTHQYEEFGVPLTKNYTVVVRAYNVNDCFDDSLQVITLLASPKIQLTALPAVCQNALPLDISFSATDIFGLGGSGIKISGNGISSNKFSPAVAGIGTFAVNYADTAMNGCISTAQQNITVKPTPVSRFNNAYTVFENGSVRIQPAAAMDPVLEYQWSPAIFLDDATAATPTVINPLNDITYSVKISSAGNCSIDTNVQVILLSDFIVPNTFTPNNDGAHDTWVIRKLNRYPTHRVQVFNRYGQTVYETNSFPVRGWDATYKGKSLLFGTYYYVIELGGVKKPKTGYVTIIK